MNVVLKRFTNLKFMNQPAWIAILVALLINESNNFVSAKSFNGIEIGTQIWSDRNLTVSQFSNGDVITEAKTEDEWVKAGFEKKPARYCPNPEIPDAVFYNWYAVSDPRGIAPDGWRVPSLNDWKALVDALGGALIAGDKLKSAVGWEKEGNGSNESKFSASPFGMRAFMGGMMRENTHAMFWTATESSTKNAHHVELFFNSTEVIIHFESKQVGLNVRCIHE